MSQACETHAKVPVKGYSACAGCEIESLEKRIAELEAAGKEMLRIAALANQGSNAYNRAIINLHQALENKA